ncbi:MAG TPA: hypothetical protein VK590_06890 [Saprospiraceae bacterium]|nr:hypothetical protein [Saprospiraceae bacterium]
MLNLDYQIGYSLSKYIAISVAILQLIWLIYPFFMLLDRTYRMMTVYFPIITGFGVFAILYSLINTIGQYHLVLDAFLLKKNSITDFILLRVSSIFTGLLITINSFKVLSRQSILLVYPRLEEKMQEKYNHTIYRKLIYWESRNLSQLSIYILTLFILQVVSFNQTNHILLWTISNTVLFFIIDDWQIIKDYAKITDGLILKWHEIRIGIANVILILSTMILVWLYVNWIFALIITILFIYSIYFRYFFNFYKATAED